MVYRVNLKSFLQNPSGWGSASLARRDLIRRDLEDRFYVLYKSAKSQFKVKTYIDKDGDYYFHMKIPSEFYWSMGLTYDVVLKFNMSEKNKLDPTLANYQLNFYSNSPAFQFIYAYVYNQDGNLIPFLNRKLSRKALTQAPTVRNPSMSHGFEKSVYFAALFIRNNPKLIKKSLMKPEKLVIGKLYGEITSSTKKLEEYQRIKKQFNSAENKKNKRAAKARASVHKLFRHQFLGSSLNKNFKSVLDKKTVKNNQEKLQIHSNKVNMKKDMSVDMGRSMSVLKKFSKKPKKK